jgi:hypothetical protein
MYMKDKDAVAMSEGLKAEDRGMFRMLSPQLSHNFTKYTSRITLHLSRQLGHIGLRREGSRTDSRVTR